jgi:serine/threonine protein kinase
LILEYLLIGNTSEALEQAGYNHQLQPGTNLGNRYMIQDVLGVGGMGAVYRARDLHFASVHKLVAVKEMVNQGRNQLIRATIVENFDREANLLATLDHPAIPRIYDYFTLEDRSYLVLEFINGKDLDRLIKEDGSLITEGRVVQWAIELCDVLNYLHTHKPEPIIFRDMKPSNVIINRQDHVVLVDFGIAKPFQSGQKGTIIGTEGYSPPEQYRGEATQLADIYALGATLHHLLSGQDPRSEPPFSFGQRPIHAINPRISPELEAVVNTALQYNPEDRFSSAIEMKAALHSSARKSGTINDQAVTAFPVSSNANEVLPLWHFRSEDEIRGTPVFHNGRIYFGSYDHNVYALEAATGKLIWKYATDGGVVSRPVIFENNLFVGSEDYRLHAITLSNGKVNWTYFTKGAVRSSPVLTEGSIFVGSDDAALHAIQMTTGKMIWKTETSGPVRSTPAVEGDLIYFGTEAGEFFCLDFHGVVRWRFQARRSITSSPIIRQGVVYFGSVDATLYALDARTGWMIWRCRLGKATISTPCTVEDLLFTGSADGSITRLISIRQKSAGIL